MSIPRTRRTVAALSVLTLAGAAAWAGLSGPAPVVPTLPRSRAPAAVAAAPRAEGVRRYEVNARGEAGVTLTAPLETIRARATTLGGWIDVNAGDLRQSRGEIDVDLGTFATFTFGDDRDATQTLHARNWFEIGDGVDDARREGLRWARFRIERITAASAPSLAAVTATRDGARSVRAVDLEVEGVIIVHGIPRPQRASLTVRFASNEGGPASLTVSTRAPLSVRLRDHDVRPRDAGGALITRTLAALGRKVAEVAEVQLTATADAR
jgi:hypothetical protein